MTIPGMDMYRLLLGTGARVVDPVKTPSGHLAIKVDEHDVATEVDGATAFTIPSPLRHVIEDTVDAEPTAGQPASSSA
eukprot:8638230-Pyramimonas_sp.AAC.1